ncbi:MAG: hypothetical protein ABEI96_09010 [Haloarculaceae archaeon]
MPDRDSGNADGRPGDRAASGTHDGQSGDGSTSGTSGGQGGSAAHDPPVGADTGTAAFLRALHVRRNARRGLAVGVVVAVAVYVFFVAIPGTYRNSLYYVALAFVLAVSVAGLATVVLLLVSARRLAREL